MQYAIIAHDGKGMLEKRLVVRQRHLENIARIKGKVICAGGITNSEGQLKGSFLVMDFGTRKDLDEYLETEPYVIGNVWQDIKIETCNVVIR